MMTRQRPSRPNGNPRLLSLLSSLLSADHNQPSTDHQAMYDMLQELKRVARELEQRAHRTHDPRARLIISQKQQIIRIRRTKLLVEIRESCRQRRRDRLLRRT